MEDISGAEYTKKRQNNGWTSVQENLIAEWADISSCYRWLHDRAEKNLTNKNNFITIPVIILSTLTGSANFALNSVIPEDNKEAQRWAQFGIGGISILAGILTTLGNYFRYAQNSEANRVAAISWGKFNRLLCVELNLKPEDRHNCQDFLKICRTEQDRLVENSPQISDKIKNEFKRKFGSIPNLKKPDICDLLEHTIPYDDRDVKMYQVVGDTSLSLFDRKRLFREIVQADIDEKIKKGFDQIRINVPDNSEK